MSFRHLILASFLVTGALASVLFFVPGLVFWLFGLEGSVAAEAFARSTAVILGGLAILLWGARRAKGATQVVFARGMVVMMGGLAVLGVLELTFGRVGPGILVAALIEVALAVGFLPYVRRRF
ncbi:MAG TPA: hypothetical protein DEO85_13910 [Maritimibacter sp.]|nr:hypothetical protein [Maritimibacter sp.]